MSRVVSLAALLIALPAAAQQVPAPQVPPQQLEDRFASELGVSGGLTADETAKRAAAQSYDVAAALADLEASRAASAKVQWSYLPTVALKASYARLSKVDAGSSGFPPGSPILEGIEAENAYLVQGDLVLPLSDYVLQIPRAVAAAGKNEEATQLSERATRLTVASQARTTYWSWVGARLSRIVGQQSLDQARSYLKDAEASAAAGVISNANLLQARAGAAQAELVKARLDAGSSVAEQQLGTTLHDPPGQAYSIGETLSTDVNVEVAPLADLWNEAIRSRLEVRSLALAADALHSGASATRVQAYPQLAGFGGLVYSSPNQRWSFIVGTDPKTTWQAGAQLTWAPTAVPQILAGASQIDAQAAKLEAQRSRLVDALRVEIAAALSSLERARVAVDASDKQLVAADEAYRVRRLLFQNGRATGTEVTQAQTELTTARLTALSARINLRVAAVQLEHALGRDVRS